MTNPSDVKRQVLQSSPDPKEYWTEERLNNATPIPLPKVNADLIASLNERLKAMSGAPGPEVILEPIFPPDASFSSAIGSDDDPKVVNDVGIFPYSAIGMISFTSDGLDYTASAFSLGNNANCVMTAAHCVYSYGADGTGSYWSENVVYWLQRDGKRYAAAYPCTIGYIFCGWKDGVDSKHRDAMYDVALLNAPAGPVRKGGGLGYVQKPSENTTVIGYPSDPISKYPFNSTTMWEESSEWKTADIGSYYYGPNSLTAGISGAPFMSSEEVFKNYAFGNVSKGHEGGEITFLTTPRTDISLVPIKNLLQKQNDDVQTTPDNFDGYLIAEGNLIIDGGVLEVSDGDDMEDVVYWQANPIKEVSPMQKFDFKFGVSSTGEIIVSMEGINPTSGTSGNWFAKYVVNAAHSKTKKDWVVEVIGEPTFGKVECYIRSSGFYLCPTPGGGRIMIDAFSEKHKWTLQLQEPTS